MAQTRTEIPSIADIRDKVLNDIKRLKIRAGVSRPNVSPGSESFIKAEAWAASAQQMIAKIAALQDATMPDSAEDEDLERLALTWKGLTKSTGAGATGFVKVKCSGTVTYIEGQECTTADNLRYKVTVTTQAQNNGVVPIIGIDTGKGTNKGAGTKVTWTSPPSGSATEAYVDDAGLTNGVDPEDDAALRKRLLSALKTPAQSGSWADVAGWAESASPAVEKAFVYPAIEGPSTSHVAITVAADPDNAYTREANATLVNLASDNIVTNNPEHADILTTKCNDEELTVRLSLILPEHQIDGGPGGGWVDPDSLRWPTNTDYLLYNTTGTQIIVSTLPIVGARFVIWSSRYKKFFHSRVKSYTYYLAFYVNLYDAIPTDSVIAGDFLSPDAERIDDYGYTVAKMFAGLGPGEKTSNANLLPRSARHPLVANEWGSQLTSRHLGELSINYPEIQHIETPLSLPQSPTVASSVTDPPNILTLGHLAFYPL